MRKKKIKLAVSVKVVVPFDELLSGACLCGEYAVGVFFYSRT